jgi:hypothetical protein
VLPELAQFLVEVDGCVGHRLFEMEWWLVGNA